jgi:hypothetical protein
MKNNLIILISAIILSVSIIFSSVLLSYTINKVNLVEQNNSKVSQSLLMNSDKAAEFIGISTDTLISYIKREKTEKYSLSSYETYKFIPYVQIDGIMYFSKSELAKWVEYKTNNH